jgi:transketolase
VRNAFAAELTALAQADERVVLLSGDIGNKLFDDYKSKCPARFFNCGVAEAGMMGAAAGLAMSGLRPIVYTIDAFATVRCLEQIRVDVCYHEQPVIIVGVGGGLAYAELGYTHHACEDIGFLRMLPYMTVVCPADAVETRLALRAALQHKGPVYIRLGKKGEPVVHEKPPAFELGKGIVIQEGKEVCLLSTGNTLPLTLEAAEALEEDEGVSARVVSLHTVKPLDDKLLADAFKRFKVVATIEEHSRLGGMGAAVAEWKADRPEAKARLLRFGTPDEILHEAGEQEHARKRLGLTSERIVRDVAAALRA